MNDLRSNLAFCELLKAGASSPHKVFGSAAFRHSVAAVTPEVIATATTEWVKEALKAKAASHLVLAIASESLGLMLKHMAGPLLAVMLHVTDKTAEKLDRLIAAPMISGLAMAKRALALPCAGKANRELQQFTLRASITELERAHSLCEPTDRWSRYYVRLFQGLVSFKLKADAFGYSYLEQCVPLLDEQRVRLWGEMREKKEFAKRLLGGKDPRLAPYVLMDSIEAFRRALAIEAILHTITKGDTNRRIEILVAHELAKKGLYKTATVYTFDSMVAAA